MEHNESATLRWFVLLLVMSGVFLSTMDSGMVSTALPTIMRSLRLNLVQSDLIITTYLFTITVTLVLWGKLADLFGRINIYLLGMAIFACGAFLCYLSTGFSQLLSSRILQGLGASMMMSSGPALIKSVFPVDYLGRNLGLVGIATASGLLTGPLVSGLVLQQFSWQTIFLVTLPVNILAILLGGVLFRRYIVEPDYGIDMVDFDWPGCLCWGGLVFLWLLFFHQFNHWSPLHNFLTAFFFFALLFLFLKVEMLAKSPILPLFLFKKRDYWIGVATAAVSFAALFSVLVLIPFYLEYVVHVEVVKVGTVMMALPATIVIFSPFSGWLYDKIGAKYLTSFGLLLSGGGILSIAWLSVDNSLASIMVRLSLVGAGQSIFLSPNSAAVLTQVPEKYIGISAGILATARNFGMVTGATLSAAALSFFYGLMGDSMVVTELVNIDVASFLSAWRLTFILIASVSVIISLLSLQRS